VNAHIRKESVCGLQSKASRFANAVPNSVDYESFMSACKNMKRGNTLGVERFWR
jgi:hypothetical protein